jgi:hypothetical protein
MQITINDRNGNRQFIETRDGVVVRHEILSGEPPANGADVVGFEYDDDDAGDAGPLLACYGISDMASMGALPAERGVVMSIVTPDRAAVAAGASRMPTVTMEFRGAGGRGAMRLHIENGRTTVTRDGTEMTMEGILSTARRIVYESEDRWLLDEVLTRYSTSDLGMVTVCDEEMAGVGIEPGEMMLVSRVDEPEDGKLVAIARPGSERTLIRRYRDGRIIAERRQGAVEEPTEGVRIIGVVLVRLELSGEGLVPMA